MMIMKEFGLTPKDRLTNGAREPTQEDEKFARLMRGPDAFKD